MNYQEALAWLYGTQTFGIKLGLENVYRLLELMGNPQGQLRFLHVAGTNGKGSTCAMLDAMLRAGGVRSGLYTSPHLLDFRERIRVNGAYIPEEAVVDGLTLLRGGSQYWDHAPTFFEIVTVLAAWWFVREEAEVVVWETGLGGRLDATNVVRPLVSVITPIGMDHQQWLGSTLSEIAMEKAGIIKHHVPVVSAPQEEEVCTVLQSYAVRQEAPLQFVQHPYEGTVGLLGEHQRWNAALALAVLDAVGLCDDVQARLQGLESVLWPGRFQHVRENIVVDGAHNPHAIDALVCAWKKTFGTRKAHLIFGALGDKDVPTMLVKLRTIADAIRIVPIHGERACAVEDIAFAAHSVGFHEISAGELLESLNVAQEQSNPVLVAGSLFLAGEALALLQGHPAPHISSQ